MSGSVVTSLGTLLREERLQQNLTLAEISAHTRICVAILEAIEGDHFESIPGGWYRQSFLRQYAVALGLDAKGVVAEFKKQYEDPPVPLPIPRHRRPRRIWADLTWAVVSIIALIGVYQASEAARALKTFHHPDSGENAASRLSLQPAPPTEPATNGPSNVTPPKPANSGLAGTMPPSTPPSGVHVAIKATEPVWISIKCDGDPKYTGVLEGPESKTFDASGAITAIIGNAGGLEISLNGRPMGPLGAHGEVQTLELTPAGARRILGHSD